MSPFALQLKTLRIKRGLRQKELADLVGFEQSYVSALELGLKGPPTENFVENLIDALNLSDEEKETLQQTIAASQRKFYVPCEASIQVYLLLHKLREQIDNLHPVQINLIEIALNLKEELNHSDEGAPQRIRRRDHKMKKVEVEM
jgi:transcriptional regulator with XRE-family HTH domain